MDHECLDCDVTGFRRNNSNSQKAFFCQRWTECIFLFSWILWLLWRQSLPEGARVLFHFQFRRGRMRSVGRLWVQRGCCLCLAGVLKYPRATHTAFSPLCASRSIGIGAVKGEMVSLLLKDFYWNIEAVVFFLLLLLFSQEDLFGPQEYPETLSLTHSISLSFLVK